MTILLNKQAHRQLVLGSSSQPRKMLLERLLIPFEIAAPDLDETPLPDESPQDLVLRLAESKARAIAKLYPDALIIGADQVGVLNGKIQGKPLTQANAIQQLSDASGQTIAFFIGLCLFDARHQTLQTSLETFDVKYRPLTQDMILNYLQKEQPLECAGSCKAEGLGIALIDAFLGQDFTALIGLPLIRLVRMLETAGLNPLLP